MLSSPAYMVMLATLIGSGLASLDKRVNTWHWDSCQPCGVVKGRSICCCDGTVSDDYPHTYTLSSTATSVSTTSFAVSTTVVSVPTTVTATSTVRGNGCFPRNGPAPANCIQTHDRNAGYCLCSGPVATSTAVPTTISTTLTTTDFVPTTLTTTSQERKPYTNVPGLILSAHSTLSVYPFCNATLQTILNPPTDSFDVSCVAPYQCAH